MREKSAPLPARVARIAARQHGIVTRRQLLDAGLSSASIARWRERGQLCAVHNGIFSAVPVGLLTQEGSWLAAVLACGPRAALSHGPAAQLGWLLDRREHLALHVSLADRSHRRVRGLVIHRPRSLPPSDLMLRSGIPATAPTRTVWDLASTLSPAALRRVFEKGERKGWLSRPRLGELLAGSPTHAGAGAIRELLSSPRHSLAETRSLLEDLLLEICGDLALPPPLVNVPLLGYEVDFLWPGARFVVEADGGDHLTPSQRDSDNARDIALGRAGYLVRRYSSAAPAHRRVVAEEVLAILGERGFAPGPPGSGGA